MGYLRLHLGAVLMQPVGQSPVPLDILVRAQGQRLRLVLFLHVDGALVGYGNIAPEPLIELIAAGKAKDYAKARAIHDRLLPVTKNVYHRGSHMEGTVALKHALVARGILDHATVRSPLLPLDPGADVEIANAMRSAGLGKVVAKTIEVRERAGAAVS